jgi:hypothetical protein
VSSSVKSQQLTLQSNDHDRVRSGGDFVNDVATMATNQKPASVKHLVCSEFRLELVR